MLDPPDDLEITENKSDLRGSGSSDGQEAETRLANELPSELLVYIFEMAQNMLLPSEDLFRHFPLVLGDVSRYWRQVAFGAPVLWTNVDISHPRDLTALQAYLGRSKGYPIDLHLLYGDERTDPDVSPLIEVLRPHYRRCRSIRLRSVTYLDTIPGIMAILGSMCDGHFPALQRFLVEGSVCLGGLGLSYCRPPLNAVTELHLAVTNNAIAYADFSGMLRSCGESLITLCVYDDLVFVWPADLPFVHDMPSLRYLRIFGNMHSVSPLLLSISAPDLQELTIAPIDVDDLTLLEGEIYYGGKPPRFPALKSLTLTPANTYVMNTTLGLAYTCFPGIELLVLPNYYKERFKESFMEGSYAAARPLWPELDGLAVRDIGGRQDQSVLYEFVKDRQRLGVPLRTLYLDSSSMGRMSRMDWLKGQLSVVEADPWQVQCADAFFDFVTVLPS